ncbi:carbonic anhydrase [Corynebacterium sp. TAE3-ERU12]|uniref:carbonic anhydrase n=1 Tax=Corynebacterium sp. TAE3-ERU12 TaxID=2849491 RepID=UPI002104AFF1|nr:carbonic anhydrase [Corynebacterium sp. TAE3-ERU12]
MTRTPQSVWQELQEGNLRFMRDESARRQQNSTRRSELTSGQHPKAVVLACSDSRVPVEIIFDQGLGDLFVIRTAGQITDLSVLASLEFAVVSLGVPMICVLGHESCGAVKAAHSALLGGEMPSGFQRVLIEKVTPSLLAARRDGQTAGHEFESRHVAEIVEHLIDRSPEIQQHLADGTVGVVGMRYRLSDGLAQPVVARGVDISSADETVSLKK